MEAGFSLRESTIGILGLGLMGGSLALALKGHCSRIIGLDTDPSTLEQALKKNIVDQAERFPVEKFPRVDVLILATPVPGILTILQELPLLLSEPCILMDIGSTKREIVDVMSLLPVNFDPVGGHPICGKEKLGFENADANLYQKAPFVITPLDRTTQRAKCAATHIISAIGAQLIEISAADHDRILASTSHLPFLISSALAQATSQEFATLVGSGFRSTSRLAGTPSHMMMGILKSNRDHILNAIQEFRSSLNDFEAILQDENYAALELLLKQARTSYLTLTEN